MEHVGEVLLGLKSILLNVGADPPPPWAWLTHRPRPPLTLVELLDRFILLDVVRAVAAEDPDVLVAVPRLLRS